MRLEAGRTTKLGNIEQTSLWHVIGSVLTFGLLNPFNTWPCKSIK